MRILLCLFIWFGGTAITTDASADDPATPTHASDEASDWQLVWSDEFDYEGLPNPEKWTYEEGFRRNREDQYYTAERERNARVQDGRLIIEAHRERYPNAQHDPDSDRWQRSREHAEYTSASLTTRQMHTWQYGRFEFRARLPRGRGVWPAIWMMGKNFDDVGWPRTGEIDIMEYVGYDPHTIHSVIHTQARNANLNTQRGGTFELEEPWADFHIYALEWYPDRLEFYVDDNHFFTYEKDDDADESIWPYDQPGFLIINLAIGGTWGGQHGIDDDIFPQRYELDYVRIYQDPALTPDP